VTIGHHTGTIGYQVRSHDDKPGYLDLGSGYYIAGNGCDLPHEIAALRGHPSDRAWPGPRPTCDGEAVSIQ
jgi:hypothetical protein